MRKKVKELEQNDNNFSAYATVKYNCYNVEIPDSG